VRETERQDEPPCAHLDVRRTPWHDRCRQTAPDQRLGKLLHAADPLHTATLEDRPLNEPPRCQAGEPSTWRRDRCGSERRDRSESVRPRSCVRRTRSPSPVSRSISRHTLGPVGVEIIFAISGFHDEELVGRSAARSFPLKGVLRIFGGSLRAAAGGTTEVSRPADAAGARESGPAIGVVAISRSAVYVRPGSALDMEVRAGRCALRKRCRRRL
jgi:hypothetical protein